MLASQSPLLNTPSGDHWAIVVTVVTVRTDPFRVEAPWPVATVSERVSVASGVGRVQWPGSELRKSARTLSSRRRPFAAPSGDSEAPDCLQALLPASIVAEIGSASKQLTVLARIRGALDKTGSNVAVGA